MKSLSALFFIFSMSLSILINNRNIFDTYQFPYFYLFLIIILICIVAKYYVFPFFRRTIQWLGRQINLTWTIGIKIWRLNRVIAKNEKFASQLESKCEILAKKLKANHQLISTDIKESLAQNIYIWKEQMILYYSISDLLQSRVDQLIRKKHEKSILWFALDQIRTEPNTAERSEKCKRKITQIDQKINTDVRKKIDTLLNQFDLNNRTQYLVALNIHLRQIEKDLSD